MSNVQKLIEADNARKAERPSPVYESGTPGDEPLSLFDKAPPSVQEIIEAERREFQKSMSATDAKLRELEDVRIDIADVVLEKASQERHPRPDAKKIARLDARLEKLKARREAINAKHDLEASQKPGNKLAMVEEALTDYARRNRRLIPFGITDMLAPGKTLRDTTADLTDLFRAKQAERDSIIKAPRPKIEVASVFTQPGSNSEVRTRNRGSPLCPKELTSSVGPVRSEKCQKRTASLQRRGVRFLART
jgi:hypothetical protein